ncbi:MAG: NAD-dependent epimerase/dehydratase family protein [Acidobacteria bacterium ACB1]|nr:UDP-N-acetylglucosamine 4-epimerase [Pyrinomonadaceae bacterium]MCE7961298.1 NAD-dependent epimerase/dehydratase family protein [Acidobacteria bacterium ACB1]RIJ94235.1 MAG: epimerase [Acidobacteriota bacterium]
MKKNVLVTGGAGFIGSHLVGKLLAEGDWQITIVDDLNDFYSPEIKRANLALFARSLDVEFVEADIRNFAALEPVFERTKFDTIVHLAARAGVRPSLLEPQLYIETNINGTTNLLELARQHGVRQFVFGSSSSVYGENKKVPFAEADPIFEPISPYAATKAAGELICHTYSHLFGIRTVCLRFFTVYGARQRPDLAIHKFARLIHEGKPIPVFGDGSTRRDYTYIDDIIQGVRAAMAFDASMHEVFNLGESETTELSRLIELLEDALGKKATIDRQPSQPGDVPITFADISKARRMLNYNPTTKIETGIPKFVEWFRSKQAVDA